MEYLREQKDPSDSNVTLPLGGNVKCRQQKDVPALQICLITAFESKEQILTLDICRNCA